MYHATRKETAMSDKGSKTANTKKRIICFGDSLTWGYDPDNRIRFGEDTRWPQVMQKVLGDRYAVIEEGQNGRTIATDDPAEGEKNGLNYIGPCMESHTPFDILIIMLGGNDCKRKFAYSAMDIAGEMQIMLEKVQSYNHFRCKDSFKVLLVSPPYIADSIRDSWLGDSFGYESSVKVSRELAGWYKTLAEMYGCEYLDATLYVQASVADGVHLDAENQKKLGEVMAEHIKEM
ncbi:MAG: SGNH/GDSL hydrolase family protein, partial [Lachnospiraceae bacterium]|nr:SGNH/GDSL hydrolase family protein [Lachnospiraceae bacterium]